MINLHQLQIFASVIEHGSFTKAARELYLTQPSVTAQVRHLRAIVGTELFEREGRYLVPTAAGLALYEFACEAVASEQAFHQRLDAISSGESEQISLGGDSTYTVHVLPQLLTRFHSDHPGVRTTLSSDGGQQLLDRIRGDRLDLAILVRNQAPAELVVSVLGQEELVLVESTERPISMGGPLRLEDLALLPFVVPRRGRQRPLTPLDRALHERGLTGRRVIMELSTWDGIREAVYAGVGLAQASRAAVRPGIDRGELREVVVEDFRDLRTVSLVQSRRRQRGNQSKAYQQLLDLLLTQLPTLLDLRPHEAASVSDP